MSKGKRPGLIFYSLTFFLCPLLNAQATGSFSGSVTDQAGLMVSGAMVTFISQSTSFSREAKTDSSGRYLAQLLPVTDYTIRVISQGFQAIELKNVRLQVDERRELDFTLVPATVSWTVEVFSTEVSVQTSNPTLGQVIGSQQVAELPLNGRNFVQLATLVPGTTQETNPYSFFNGGGSSEVSTRGSFSLSVGGSRANSTDWLFDGIDNNELTAGGIAILPSIEAIQEFKVLTFNYSTQYGTRAGPTVLVTSKSGSNQYHGSLFEFFRNTSLDARSFFATTREKFNLNEFGGSLGGPVKRDKTFFFVDYQAKRLRRGIPFVGQVPTAAMRSGDFSEGFAGVAQLYNPFSTQIVGNNITRDPFMCDGQGNPVPVFNGFQKGGTPCNKIPPSLINPIAKQMINLYPLPNVDGTLVGDFVSVPVRKLNEGEFDVRLDHNFGTKDSLFARFSYDQATTFVPGGSPGFAEPDVFSSTQNITNHGRNAALSETHIFSASAVNQLNVGFNRIFNVIKSFGDGTCESAKLGIPGANINSKCPGAPVGATQSTTFCVSCGLTATFINGGYWALGDRGYSPFQGGTNIYHVSEAFDMIRGNHNLRVGGEFRANQMNVMANAFQDGLWAITNSWTSAVFGTSASGIGGDGMATFLLGLEDQAIHDQTFDGATTGRRWKLFRPYVQDDWRLTPNLTLNLGLAWALVTPITETHDRQANFNFATGEFLIPGLNSDGRVGLQFDKTAFEPRIGLAWKPFGSNKAALRAGYAIFHDSSWNQGAQGLWQNPPYFEESNFIAFFPDLCPNAASRCAQQGMPVTGKSISEGFPVLTQPTDPSKFDGNILEQNLRFKQGMVQQYNLNVEHQLPGDIVLTLGYAGSHSSHILVDGMNLNVTSPTACGMAPGYVLGCGLSTTTPPYPQFGSISNVDDIGAARYDSLQIKAETKRTRHGFYALLGYTYARNFDSGFSDSLGTTTGATYYPLPGTARADWGLSQIQLNHNFTASVIYDLPFGRGRQFGSTWRSPLNTILGNWEVNVIQRITSGFPLFMVASTNISGVLNGLNRPDQLCSGQLGHPSLEVWFNTKCFVDPLPGELGNSRRTALYGPGFVNTDFSAVKRFPLRFREGAQLDFRAEFFNLFNHAQFFQPGQDVDSFGFGKITATVNNPRLIQFALKLGF